MTPDLKQARKELEALMPKTTLRLEYVVVKGEINVRITSKSVTFIPDEEWEKATAPQIVRRLTPE